jgi:non-heme chloroperoxidase
MRISLTKVLLGVLCVSPSIVAHAVAQDVKWVEASGTRFAYVEQGRGDPVVFVHGSVADYRIWAAQIVPFSAHYRVVSYSRRYHYPNPPADATAAANAARHAADLADFIDALKIAPAHVIGHSSGGTVAAYLVRDRPELVRSVVLAEPATFGVIAQHPEAKALADERGAAMAPVKQAIEASNNDEAVRKFLDYWLAPRGFAGLSASNRAEFLANGGSLAPEFRATAPAKPFNCEDARKIEKPTLLLDGETTIRVFTVVLDEFAKCSPNAERVTLAGTGHGLQLENPKAFNEAVLRFLAKH